VAERYVSAWVAPSATPPPPEADPQPPARRPPVQRALDVLEPLFRRRLESMIGDLAGRGYRPRVWETLRTPERGDWLEERGRTRNGRRSMHVYGVAADIICREHMWDCHRHGCDYYAEQGRAARRAGLYWGGDWRSMRDYPHVQAVAVGDQARVRRADDVAALLPHLMRGV